MKISELIIFTPVGFTRSNEAVGASLSAIRIRDDPTVLSNVVHDHLCSYAHGDSHQ